MELEMKVKNFIKEQSTQQTAVKIPLSEIAERIDSSTASVYRVVKKLEDKRVIKIVKPTLKTEPNSMYYLGEEDELNYIIEDLMMKTANLLILMKELKKKVREKDDIIFNLMQERDR